MLFSSRPPPVLAGAVEGTNFVLAWRKIGEQSLVCVLCMCVVRRFFFLAVTCANVSRM